jgi:methyl-accepting chemotaxis protein
MSRDSRDLWFLIALLAHAPAALLIGLFMSGDGLLHIVGEAVAPAAAAAVAYALFANTRAFRLAGAVLLMLYSGVIIHLGGGMIEWHFHVFVAMAALILYYDWAPIVVAAGTIAVHHIVMDELLPMAVFNHATEPNRWVVVQHALFVVMHTAGCVFLAEKVRRSAAAVEGALAKMAEHCAPAVDGGLQAIAAADLTFKASAASVRVPAFGNDEIGRMAARVNSLGESFDSMLRHYEQARSGLGDIIDSVQTASDELRVQSSRVRSATHGMETGAEYVGQEIERVSKTAHDTSRGAETTSAEVQLLRESIDGIASGAVEQARQVQAASATATQMASGVEQVAASASEVAAASQQTREAAEQGAEAVRATVSGMAGIQTVVSQAAEKVRELGQLGQRIGAVVETIDEIAEQTNLLALNAAIEAARAGAHGKGFAVVADEVRKLAERSSRETKQIGELIALVQQGTQDAVGAMQRGSDEVASGSARADEAGRALSEILKAVDNTVRQVTEIAASAQEMASGARSVTDAMASISAVVEENTASTEEMSEQSNLVASSIAEIASVAGEQSESTRQVNAAADQMRGTVVEVRAQADELAQTADTLQAMVARFKRAAAPAAAVVPAPTAAVPTRRIPRAA